MRDENQRTKIETLTVTAGRVRSTSESFGVYSASIEGEMFSSLTVKQFLGPVRTGQRWVCVGNWVEDPRFGRQFVAQFATLATPRTFEELAAFITSGLVAGWSWQQLVALQEAFGQDAGTVIDQEPHRLMAETGITEEQYESLMEMWARGAGLAPIFAQLTQWGIGSALSERLVKRYRFATTDVIQEDPYAPIQDVAYYTWRTAENVAGHLGIADDDPRRIQAGVAEVIRANALEAGHTWMTRPAAVASAMDLLGLGAERIEEILAAVEVGMEDAEDSALLIRCGDQMYPGNLWFAERYIAASVAQRLSRQSRFDPESVEALLPVHPHMCGDTIDTDPGIVPENRFTPTKVGIASSLYQVLGEEQQAAVVMALTNTVSLLTGGPGCGKTTAIRTIVAAARELGMPITLLAPTGKAAQRMREATDHEAATIHRKLKLIPGQSRVGPDTGLLTGLVVCDEVSMLDTLTASALFSGISLDAHVLLVGDPDQLPSVGPGAVLRDVLMADVCTRIHLTRVYRNEMGIAINAQRIRAGEHIQSLPDCRLMQAQRPEDAQHQIVTLLLHDLPAMGYTRDDVLVLTPTNEGESGRHTLNGTLQALFNGAQSGHGITQKAGDREYELRVGDKVIVTKNTSDLGVFNGDTGRVVSVQPPKTIIAEIDGREVTFTGQDRQLLQLAYAITGHKAQGSEAPVVIVPVFFSRVLSREWLYTVLTRARKQVYLLGDPAAIQGCIRQVRVNERRTGLVAALQETIEMHAPEDADVCAYAYSEGSAVYHTRRKAVWWRTACGCDTRGPEWAEFPYSHGRPCLRCQATTGAVLKPFEDSHRVLEIAV